MKKFSVLAIVAVLALGVAFTSCDSRRSGSAKLNSEVDSISFIIGKVSAYSMLKNTKTQMESWPEQGNYDAFIAGLNVGLDNPDDSLFFGKDMASLNEYINGFFMRLQQKMTEATKEEGEKFLAENKTRSGVITTESGLQYRVITEGTGAKPKATDVVKLHYTGKFLNGTVFDSSVDRGEPLQMTAGSFVPGFSEGLQLMPVGSKYILYIPSELGYGETGNQIIQPNSALEFEVELLEIVN